MAKLVCIQAGHYPRTSGATGAPGEQELNWRITNRLDDLLIARGIVVQIVGADPTDAEIKKDYDLFISLHGESDTHNADGGMISAPDPSVDSVFPESNRIKEAIESVYFKESGITNRPEWVTNNMRFYYMWKRLTAKTPCVILEMGVVQNAHDKVILADTERVAVAIAKGICKAFGIDYEPTPTPTPTPEPPVDPCEEVKKALTTAQKDLLDQQKVFSEQLALKDKECEEKMASYKQNTRARLLKVAEKLIDEALTEEVV